MYLNTLKTLDVHNLENFVKFAYKNCYRRYKISCPLNIQIVQKSSIIIL